MRAATDHNGKSKGEASSLEDEVAAWRTKRVLRHGATTGKVQVVRISKRVVPPFHPSASRARSGATP